MNKKDKLKAATFFCSLFLILGFMLAAYFHFTSVLVNTADDFLQSVESKATNAQSIFLSDDFKRHITESSFSKYISATGLNSYVSAQWSSRSIKGNRGSLVGVITTEYRVLPATISLVKEDAQWKIYSLQIRTEQSQQNEDIRELPDQQTQLLLAKEALSTFVTSVQQKSMQPLFNSAAAIWQKNITINKLDAAFERFYSEDITLLSQINNQQPVFEHVAKLDDEGFMLMAGFYTLEAQKLSFEQRYIYEGLGWKLVGLDVRLGQ
ncbi:MAG: hypothetical protein ACJAUT_001087 [Cellvibrionaceae bacterium]|jgi:hypothetical protein